MWREGFQLFYLHVNNSIRHIPRTDLVLVKAAAPAIKEAKTAVFISGDKNRKK
jgi:hypothetical protein